MFKKTIMVAAIVATVITAGNAAKIEASASKPAIGIDVIVDGKKTTFPDTEPFIDANNNTMVPIRFVSEKLGATVLWNNDTQVVTLQYNGKNIVMPVGSKSVTVDGVTQTLTTSAIKVEGRVMVPLRFVSETLGTIVEWDQDAVMINITSLGYQAKISAGEVKLDFWGREVRQSQTNSFWTTLTDTEDWAYNIKPVAIFNSGMSTDTALGMVGEYGKYGANTLNKRIKEYYMYALNIDYRTFNKTTFSNNLSKSTTRSFTVSDNFSNWIRSNKIVVEGYAFPEGQFYYRNAFYYERVKFKFRVVSGSNVTQFNLDSFNVTDDSVTPNFVKKGVWYYGYSDVSLDTKAYDMTGGNIKPLFSSLKMNGSENMFRKGSNQYKKLK